MEESKYSYEGWTPEHKPNVIMAIELIDNDITQLGTPYFFGDTDAIVEDEQKFNVDNPAFEGENPESNNDNFILLVKTNTDETKLYRLVQSIKSVNRHNIQITPIETYIHEWRTEIEIMADLNDFNYTNAIKNLQGVFPENEQLNARVNDDKKTVVEILANIKKNEDNTIIAASVAYIRQIEEDNRKAAAVKAAAVKAAAEADAKAAAVKAAAEEKARKAEAAAEEKARKAEAAAAVVIAAKAEAVKAAADKARLAAEADAKAEAVIAAAEADAKAEAVKAAAVKAAAEAAEEKSDKARLAAEADAKAAEAEQAEADAKAAAEKIRKAAEADAKAAEAEQAEAVKAAETKRQEKAKADYDFLRQVRKAEKAKAAAEEAETKRQEKAAEEEAETKRQEEAEKAAAETKRQEEAEKAAAEKAAAETKRKAIPAETARDKIARKKWKAAQKTREESSDNTQFIEDEKNKILNQKQAKVANERKRQRGGGSIAMNLRNIIEELNQYARRVLMNSFYFKLSALTPDNINKLKDKIIDKEKNLTFNDLLLKPFMEFAYVQFDFERVKQSSLEGDLKHIIEVIMASTEQKVDKNIIPIFIRSIEKDTTNYASITQSTDTMKKAIHIFRFIELINNSFKQNETDRNKNLQNFDSYALQKIIEHLYLIPNVYKLSQQKYNIDIAIDGNTKSYDLQVYIDGLIDTQNRTNIITFLKINNTEPNNISMINKYNERYQIKLDQVGIMDTNELKSTSMILGYRNNNFPYYKQIEDTIKASPYIINNNDKSLTGITLTNINNNENDVEIRSVNNYTNNYLFGKFQEIFPMYSGNTLITNEKISLQMSSITEQICEKNKPVFLLGYGVSGSGKTSSLIYFNNATNADNKDGILVHLCKQIIKNKINNNKVGSVKVTIQEYTSPVYASKRDRLEYTLDSGLNVIVKDNTYIPYHEYHTKLATDNSNFKITNETTLGELLKQLVDVDRLVKATPNNPQSSRSHVLVFISFCSDDAGNETIGNLIVGDFAGKENEFQCDNIDVITDFLNKKITNSESKYKGKPFYSSQLNLNEQTGGGGVEKTKINNELDPYQKLEMNDNNKDKLELLRIQEPLFDFVKPSNSNIIDKEFANTYSSIILDYIFNKNKNVTSNSGIYTKLLGNTDDLKTSDSGINIIKTYKQQELKTDGQLSDKEYDKKSTFLQHLIYKDLFEGNIADTEIIDDNKLSDYNYKDKLIPIFTEIITATPKESGVTPKYNIKEQLDLKKKISELIKKDKLIDEILYGKFSSDSQMNDSGYNPEINKINEIIGNNDKYIPKNFTTDYIKNNIVKLLTVKNNSKWTIKLNIKEIKYNDKYDKGKSKYFPVIKTFTIETMCEHFMTNRFKSLSPFFQQIKDELKGQDDTIHVKQFNYILNSLVNETELTKYVDLMNTYNEKIKETQIRLEYGQTICSNRVIEGKFINNSLEVIRKEIKKILNIKHKHSDALFNSPDYIDICLKSYCPTNQNCFEIKTETIDTDNTNTINLFDEIYEKLQNIPKYKEPNGKEEFYKDIVISIFGVFNVSRLTDNPPPHPYIDINDLKQIYYNKGDIHERELLPLLHNLKTFVEQDIDITNKTNTKLTEAVFYQKIKTLYDVGIRYHNNEPGLIFNINKIEQRASSDVKYLLKQMIEEIDIHNASSTIGTLEFLDQVSKFASVHNLCSNANPYLDNNDYKTYDSNMKNINTDN